MYDTLSVLRDLVSFSFYSFVLVKRKCSMLADHVKQVPKSKNWKRKKCFNLLLLFYFIIILFLIAFIQLTNVRTDKNTKLKECCVLS